MHQDFPRWHTAIAIGNDTERRNARWAAVYALAENADMPLVEALVRLAFATKQTPSGQVLSRIHEAYRQTDETFDASNAAREIQVLAAACLAVLFESSSDTAATAALSVATAGLAGGRTAQTAPWTSRCWQKPLSSAWPKANRKRPSLTALFSEDVPKLDFDTAATKAKEETAEAFGLKRFTLAATATRTAIRAILTRQAAATRTINRVVQIQDEELQMLWWLIGARSVDFDCAFDAVPADAQPLVFGSELADSTTLLPGPRSIRPLLTRAGLKERKKLTLAAAIGAAGSAWLSNVVGERDPSPVTQPIHFRD